MSSLVQLTVGSVFAGDFKVVRPLTEGGMGAVYVVEQISTGKQRALKIMHPQLLHDATMRQRFVQEAKIGARIESDHVVEVVSAGIDAATNTPWIVMELLIGETLESKVEREGPRPHDEVQLVFSQLGHAVAAAHDVNIVHRDLKPENIFLGVPRREGVPFVVKVLDFGIAKLVAEADTRSTQAIGSPLWMAPEQAQTGSVISPATDVWSLGLVAFWMLTGQSFWKGAQEESPNPMKLMLEVCFEAIPTALSRAEHLHVAHLLPTGFDGWFSKCVARDPAERFGSARQLRAALEVVLGGGVAPPLGGGSGQYRASMLTPPIGAASPQSMRRAPVAIESVPDLPDFAPPVSAPAPAPVASKSGSQQAAARLDAPVANQPRQRGLSARDKEVLASLQRERKAVAATTAGLTAPRASASRPASFPIAKVAIGTVAVFAILGAAQRFLWTHPVVDTSKLGLGLGESASAVATPSASGPKAAVGTCPSTMASIPGGTFTSAAGPVVVDPFCLDKTEITVEAYAACVKAGTCKPAFSAGNWPESGEGGIKNQACNVGRKDRAGHPINCVDWSQATAYCAAQGGKLPTDAQWEWADRGARARTTYPWGNDAPTPGQMCWSNDARHTSTCPAGKMDRGNNPFGVADLEGNVREWTSQSSSDTEAILCGSDWTDSGAESLHPFGYCGTARKVERSAFVGFRCVKSL